MPKFVAVTVMVSFRAVVEVPDGVEEIIGAAQEAIFDECSDQGDISFAQAQEVSGESLASELRHAERKFYAYEPEEQK